MNKKTLFGFDKVGGIKQWSVWTQDDALFIEFGKFGGKLQLKEEKISGKNIGRANETTPTKQAELEAESRYKKQLDKNYRENVDHLERGALDFLPMLAHDYLKQGHRIKYPCYVSAKLDGVRCLATRYADSVQLKSRGGKEYTIRHVQEQLMSLMKEGEIWDGELYIHGLYLEEIVSAVKKPNDNTPRLTFVVFDIVTDSEFEARLSVLKQISNKFEGSVAALMYDIVHDEDGMKKLHKVFVTNGFEGIMLRNKTGHYENGKRSADLQKYKEFLDDEFEIIGVSEDRNGNAVLDCFDQTSGRAFGVCFGDFNVRQHQLKNKHLYIGKMLTVKYQTRYKDSRLPQFPAGICIRDYE